MIAALTNVRTHMPLKGQKNLRDIKVLISTEQQKKKVN